ncbi:MAG TPA: glycosyltransferase family 2 protein [Streptosporangiaceae bacterium]|nr:glycosyltransferase family 2 protein [Streptosporangiaceae bacterium]
MSSEEPARAWPSVTVVIPTRDRPELLRETLDSIRDHDYPGELRSIVVFDQSEADDGVASDKPGREVVAISNTRTPGAAGARNTGILAARTELVACCDDTDLWLPGKLRAQAAVLRDDPQAEFVTCGLRLFNDTMSADRSLGRGLVRRADLLKGHLPQLHPSGFVIRRDAMVDGFGLFDETIPGSYGEDYELLVRAAGRTPIRNLPMIGAAIRWHKESYFGVVKNAPTISAAGQWLLRRYPFPAAGYAHWAGKVAFAEATRGARRSALRWAAKTMARRPLDPRAVLAVLVALGVPAEFIIRQLDRTGHGI